VEWLDEGVGLRGSGVGLDSSGVGLTGSVLTIGSWMGMVSSQSSKIVVAGD